MTKQDHSKKCVYALVFGAIAAIASTSVYLNSTKISKFMNDIDIKTTIQSMLGTSYNIIENNTYNKIVNNYTINPSLEERSESRPTPEIKPPRLLDAFETPYIGPSTQMQKDLDAIAPALYQELK
jgi:hypothetical protein